MTVICVDLLQDLKKYIYYYWFAYPAFKLPAGYEPKLQKQQSLDSRFTSEQV